MEMMKIKYQQEILSLLAALCIAVGLFFLLRLSFFIQLFVIFVLAVGYLLGNKLMKTNNFPKWFLNLNFPQIFLVSVSAVSLFMVIWYSSPFIFNVKSGVYKGLVALVQSPKGTYIDKKIYVYAQPNYGKSLGKLVEDGSSILFLNDRPALSGGMSIYYNIHLYMDSNVRYYFDTKDKQYDEKLIMKNMSENHIKYLFRYDVQDNILPIPEELIGKSILYEFRDGKLVIVSSM